MFGLMLKDDILFVFYATIPEPGDFVS